MVHPVSSAGATKEEVYLPGGTKEFWYEVETYEKYAGTGRINFAVTMDKVILFLILRGNGYKKTFYRFQYSRGVVQ